MKCGSTTPGPTCQWENNYTECGECYSLSICPLCSRRYRLDELIIQCRNCNRWCHSMCANVFTEEMAEKMCQEQSFLCLLCQPDQSALMFTRCAPTNSFMVDQHIHPCKSVKCEDGVYLTEHGLTQMKAIRPKIVGQTTRKSKQSGQKAIVAVTAAHPPVAAPMIYKQNDAILINEEDRSDEEKLIETPIKKPAVKKYTGKRRDLHVKMIMWF